MKLLTLVLIAISLSPLPAIAEPLNLPFCYMVTPSGRLINLNYMCESNTQKQAALTELKQKLPEVTADDLCSLAASERLAATNQFQADEADKFLNICQNDRKRIESFTRLKLKK